MSANVAAVLGAAAERLARAGVPEPRADAEVLLADVLGCGRADLVAGARARVAATARARFDTLLAARATRVPIFYLVGRREFWSLEIAVDARVLIPRPETELLIETACRVAPAARTILDAGTGSGAVGAALAREFPGARVVASDRDAGALAVARANFARLAPGVVLLRGDWLAPFRRGAFDLIVANPPYVRDAELETLAPEVRDHEPAGALAGGHDGLAAIRTLVAEAPEALAGGGWLVVEMGQGQAAGVGAALAADARYGETMILRDHGGIERVLATRVQRHAREGSETWTRS